MLHTEAEGGPAPSLGSHCCCAASQAAQSLAEHASRNASDTEYESPYTEEAIRSGMDLPWWQKIITTSLDFGELKLGKLTVSVQT